MICDEGEGCEGGEVVDGGEELKGVCHKIVDLMIRTHLAPNKLAKTFSVSMPPRYSIIKFENSDCFRATRGLQNFRF